MLRWVSTFTPRPLYSLRKPPVSLSTQWRPMADLEVLQKPWFLSCPACRLVTILTELHWIFFWERSNTIIWLVASSPVKRPWCQAIILHAAWFLFRRSHVDVLRSLVSVCRYTRLAFTYARIVYFCNLLICGLFGKFVNIWGCTIGSMDKTWKATVVPPC